MAKRFADNENQPLKMSHVEAAVHEMYAEKLDLERDEVKKYATSVHELGHAIALMHKSYRSEVLHYVEVQVRKRSRKQIGDYICGHNVVLPIKTIKKKDNNFRNFIIVLLCGRIAEQVIVESDIKDKNLKDLLSNDGATRDVENAYLYAEKLAAQDVLSQSYYRFIPFYTDFKIAFNRFDETEKILIKERADQIIEECYDEGYQFIADHEDEIKIVADILKENGSISGDDLYNIFKIEKPLFDFESGPLPEGLVENYKERGQA